MKNMQKLTRFFLKGTLFIFALHISQSGSLASVGTGPSGIFFGLGGGTSSVAGVQDRFGWDFHIKAGIGTPFLDLGLSVGGVGVQTKVDPITGERVSGVTTAGGTFEEVQKEVTYNLYLVPLDLFLTGKVPVYGLLSVTGTFAVGYLFDINTRGSFLDALGSVSLPDEATPIESRNTILFQGYSLTGLVGIELNFQPLFLFIDAGYRYSRPEITTKVPVVTQNSQGETVTSVVEKTFRQDVSGFTMRVGVKFMFF